MTNNVLKAGNIVPNATPWKSAMNRKSPEATLSFHCTRLSHAAKAKKLAQAKYIPNAIVVTDSDDDNNVLAVIYDANDIDWNDGLKDASNNPAEF